MITTLAKQSAAFLALTEAEGFISNRIRNLKPGSPEDTESKRVLSKIVASKEEIRTDLEKAASIEVAGMSEGSVIQTIHPAPAVVRL